MAYFTYDTSVLVSRKQTELLAMPSSFLMSAIVLMELSSSAPDLSRRNLYETLFAPSRKSSASSFLTWKTGYSHQRFYSC